MLYTSKHSYIYRFSSVLFFWNVAINFLVVYLYNLTNWDPVVQADDYNTIRYDTTGCFNLLCPSFVVLSQNAGPRMVLPTGSGTVGVNISKVATEPECNPDPSHLTSHCTRFINAQYIQCEHHKCFNTKSDTGWPDWELVGVPQPTDHQLLP